jgi:beta-lactamase superfamily II metal-dependent hydrolase
LTAIITAGVLAILTWQAAFALPDGRLHLTLLSSAPPASLLVQTSTGRAVLINGGADSPQLSQSLSQKLPFFSRRLDYLVVASTDKNALQALPAVLNNLPTAAVLWNRSLTNSQAAQNLEISLNDNTIPVTLMSTGDSLDLGDGAQLIVLEADESGTLLLLYWRSFRALLPFPAAGAPLAGITTTPPAAVNVLLLGGHGEDALNPPAWLSALQPQLVIASQDLDPAQPRIGAQVQAALNGYPLLTNVDRGWIEISTDGEKMWVTTEK